MIRASAPAFKTLLDFAHTLADRSGAAILPHFRKAIPVEDKGAAGAPFDPVTAADRGAERVIRRLVAERFPDHGIVGEEFGSRGAGARFQWVIDPIDGTRAFITGLPIWGTLIGLLDDGAPVLGVMDQPFLRERYWSGARAAHRSTCGGRAARLRTRACARIPDAVLMTTAPELFERGFETSAFQAVKDRVRLARYGADCYAYCMLASGFVDAVVEAGLKAHDVVALIPIIERAGGVITTWDGGPAAGGGRIVAAGDPALHEAVLRLLNR